MVYTHFNESKWQELHVVIKLLEKENGEDAWSQFKAAGEHIAPLIESTPTGLEYLTSHGVGHCYRIARRIGDILPDITDLNGTEIFTLLCAILYHDIGMWRYSDDEIDQYLENEDFQRFARLHFKALFDKVNQLRASDEKEERVIGLLELIRLIAQWNRAIHPFRSAEILRKGARDDIVGKNIPEDIADGAATIIEAHGWDSNDVLTTLRLNGRPFDCFGCQDFVNLRYLSVLLRLGDLLDVGKERVPQIVKQSLGKELLPLESKAHWIKEEKLHIIEIAPDLVKIDGLFNQKKMVEIKAFELAQSWIKFVEEEINNLHSMYSDPQSYGLEDRIKNGIGQLKLYPTIFTENSIIKNDNTLRYLTDDEINLLKIYYDFKLDSLKESVEDINKNYLTLLEKRDLLGLESGYLKDTDRKLHFFVYLYPVSQTKISINKKLYKIFLEYIQLCNKIRKFCDNNDLFYPSFPHIDKVSKIMEKKT